MTDRSDEVAGVQAWMALDIWTALGLDSLDFPGYYERNGFGTTWAVLASKVRDMAQGHLACTINLRCVLRGQHIGPCVDSSDVGRTEPLPAVVRR